MLRIRRIVRTFFLAIACLLALSSFCIDTEARTKSNPTIPIDTIAKEVVKRMKEVETEAKTKAEEEKKTREEEEARLKAEAEEEEQAQEEWNGEVLTAWGGVANGPSGLETYYNLPMGGVVSIMRNLGYDEANYPYWVRDDGCKMLGDYIMVAANLNIRPEGTILPTSLGMGIVCDTGTFAQSNPYQLDIAVDW